jgi:chaperonin cofactor prefoldin
MDDALVKQLKQRVEEELRQRETAFLEFWLQELKNIDARRHKDLASLQSDLKGMIGRMETRIRSLKRGLG